MSALELMLKSKYSTPDINDWEKLWPVAQNELAQLRAELAAVRARADNAEYALKAKIGEHMVSQKRIAALEAAVDEARSIFNGILDDLDYDEPPTNNQLEQIEAWLTAHTATPEAQT